MMKVLTIVGPRPQIIKSAAITRAIKNSFAGSITEVLLHTGQHYDEKMSGVFFSELEIPLPKYNLNVGSGTHAVQTAAMLTGIENVLNSERPDAVIVFGDTNSTLAGAMAAAKLQIPVVHIEAGLRSFNKTMPEELNRVLTDHMSSLLFTPTQSGFDHLLHEGFSADATGKASLNNPLVFKCGDIMLDNSLYFSGKADEKTGITGKLGLRKNEFILATVHRDINTDNAKRLNAIFEALFEISSENSMQVVVPLHPRTAKMMEIHLEADLAKKIHDNTLFTIIPPASFLEIIALEKNALMFFSDSGGVQKESYFFKKPCIIFREETEWTDLTQLGTAVLADADKERIKAGYRHFAAGPKLSFPDIFGDGKAAEFICATMLKTLS